MGRGDQQLVPNQETAWKEYFYYYVTKNITPAKGKFKKLTST